MNTLTVTETISLLAGEAQHAGALAPVVTASGQGIESIAAQNGRVVVTFQDSRIDEQVYALTEENSVLQESFDSIVAEHALLKSEFRILCQFHHRLRRKARRAAKRGPKGRAVWHAMRAELNRNLR